jgi:hypothetical protein
LALAGCRPDPGPTKYDSQESFDGGNCGLAGPVPFMPGDKRLSVGAFYECQVSDTIAVDDKTSHVYLYLNGTQVTVNKVSDTKDKVEGSSSDDLVLTGQPWWGMGINWDIPHDLSAWKTMHVSFKSKEPAFSTFTIGINNGVSNGDMISQTTATVNSIDYGYVADDSWHNLSIPLSAFTGIDTSRCTAPFVIGGTAGPSGAVLKVDALYFTQN